MRLLYAESIDYSDKVLLPSIRPADIAWVRAQVEEWRAEAGR